MAGPPQPLQESPPADWVSEVQQEIAAGEAVEAARAFRQANEHRILGELREFLLLAREEGWAPLEIKGSYAGAMGLPQFISSSYRRLAVDFDGDGFPPGCGPGDCDDGDPCTDNDMCTAGVCNPGSAFDCSGLDNVCTNGVCQDDGSGNAECVPDYLAAGTSCDDGLFCTGVDTCDGSGAKDGEKQTCSTCGGVGQVRMQQGFFSIQQTCPSCRGAGKVISGWVVVGSRWRSDGLSCRRDCPQQQRPGRGNLCRCRWSGFPFQFCFLAGSPSTFFSITLLPVQ